MQNAYWKLLLDGINKEKAKMLGIPVEELKEKEAEAVAALNPYEKTQFDIVAAKLTSYKAHFKALQEFIKTEVLANFSEFDLYIPASPAELGECMIIPARWIGDAASPTFYFFVDGLLEEKA